MKRLQVSVTFINEKFDKNDLELLSKLVGRDTLMSDDYIKDIITIRGWHDCGTVNCHTYYVLPYTDRDINAIVTSTQHIIRTIEEYTKAMFNSYIPSIYTNDWKIDDSNDLVRSVYRQDKYSYIPSLYTIVSLAVQLYGEEFTLVAMCRSVDMIMNLEDFCIEK